MADLWMPGIEHDFHEVQRRGYYAVSALLNHRTIGRWAGDYATLSRQSVPSVHFLVGQDDGQSVQFLPANMLCAGAAGANNYAVQIEFSGQNGEPLTPWQLAQGGAIYRWVFLTFGIPKVFLDKDAGRVSFWNGVLNHSNVATTPNFTHYDFIERHEFDLMSGQEEDDLPYTADQLKLIFIDAFDKALDQPAIQNKIVLLTAAGDNAAKNDED